MEIMYIQNISFIYATVPFVRSKLPRHSTLNSCLSISPIWSHSTHLPAPEDKCATLDGVDNNVATGQEGVVAPSANKVGDASAGSVVVLGIDIEVANLTD